MAVAPGRAASVLALRALGLGDLLTGLPALRALRAGFPDAELVLAAPASLEPLVRLAWVVDRLLPTAGVGPDGPPALDWTGPRPDVAVNLHGRGPQSTRRLAELRPGRLVAYDCPAAGVRGPQWRRDEHEVARWCRLLNESGVPADPADLSLPRPHIPSPAPGAVVIHPGAAAPARRWPARRFAAVAEGLCRDGWRVVVTGSAAEAELASAVASGAGLPPAGVLAGRTGLLELAALVADAALVVSGDTGVAHLASAYGTPSVVLFGPTPPAWWGPPPRAQHVALWAGSAPGDPHAGVPDPALLALPVERVLTATRAQLGSVASSGAGSVNSAGSVEPSPDEAPLRS